MEWISVDGMIIRTAEIVAIKDIKGGSMIVLKSGIHLASDMDVETWEWILETGLPEVEIMSVDEEKFQDLLECLDPECEVKITEEEMYFKFHKSLKDAPEGSIITEEGVYAPVKVYKALLKG